MSTVLIAGGSGLIGQRLSVLLEKKGYDVIFLSRKKKSDDRFFQWDVNKGTIDSAAIERADYVINLAGAGIVDKRWTNDRKKVLIESRTQTAALLKDSFEKIKKPKAYLSASAIGFYGNRGDEWLTESSEPQPEDFLSECTMAWENAAKRIAKSKIRTAIFRIGIVLSMNGGALPEMILPMKFGARVSFGDGKAYYPWVHIDDVCSMFIWALENESVNGIYNAVAPKPIMIKDLVKEIQEARGGFALPIPAPSFALKLVMGEMADMLLNSARVSAEKILASGYEFKFSEIQPALKNILEEKV
ncbi:MAG: TIGR01777 family oxidoreductase [Saprospiraceae bacterium]